MRYALPIAWTASVIVALSVTLATPSYACTFNNDGRKVCDESVAKSKGHSRRVTDANGNWLVTIKASNGRTAKVAARYSSQFQGFIADLERAGYRIDFIGGWRAHGSCRRCDAHPAGRAIDVNQTARNRVTRRLPPNITTIAARHGLCHGAIWGNPDRGHFEVAEKSRATSCHRFAREHWPRVVERIETP